jgi:hypothetical protein
MGSGFGEALRVDADGPEEVALGEAVWTAAKPFQATDVAMTAMKATA